LVAAIGAEDRGRLERGEREEADEASPLYPLPVQRYRAFSRSCGWGGRAGQKKDRADVDLEAPCSSPPQKAKDGRGLDKGHSAEIQAPTTRRTTMKVIVLVKANKDSEAGAMPSPEQFREMGKFNEELVKAGVMLAGEGLAPSSRGKRVRCEGKARTVIDGPFAETKELLAGFWIWQVRTIEEAVEWLRRSPFQDGEIEIRPIMAAEDFGDALPPDVAAQEARLRQQAGKRS
jgi:hypothetical protein